MAKGIKDKVVILGMGCSKFGERWDKEADNLMVEAYTEAIADAGIDTKQIDAAWLATAIEEQHVGKSATPLAVALRLPFIPVTRVENYCASGTEAFRGAVYAVASGAADIALAMGVEKLKDTGYGGLPQRGRGPLNDMVNPNASAPGSFAQLAAAYRAKHQVDAQGPQARHGAHLRQEPRQRRQEPQGAPAQQDHRRHRAQRPDGGRAARPLRLLRRERRRRLRHRHHARDRQGPRQEGHGLGEGAAGRRVERAGGRSTTPGTAATSPPRASPPSAPTRRPASTARATSSDLFEVHDCFSVTELVTMEDLHISPEGGAIKDVLDGFYDADGKVPCQIDGGLKCFGHPIGASGLRMIYEMYLQMHGRAGERQRSQEPMLRPDPQPRRLPAAQRVRHLHRRQVRGVTECTLGRAKRRPLPLAGRGQGWGSTTSSLIAPPLTLPVKGRGRKARGEDVATSA